MQQNVLALTCNAARPEDTPDAPSQLHWLVVMLMADCWIITLAKNSQDGPVLVLMSLKLAAPAGTRRLILLLLRTRPSPPQVLQGVDSSPCPSHVGHCITCKSTPTTWAPEETTHRVLMGDTRRYRTGSAWPPHGPHDAHYVDSPAARSRVSHRGGSPAGRHQGVCERLAQPGRCHRRCHMLRRTSLT